VRRVTQLGIPGDTILAKINESSELADDRWYEGHVHYVHEAEVGLRFHYSFQEAAAQELDVRFQLNRVTLRRQHQALCANHFAPHLLFPPTHEAPLSMPSDLPITLYDPKIGNNVRQLWAVRQILSLPSSSTSAPYIIFGP
jgi:helicase MOV-10